VVTRNPFPRRPDLGGFGLGGPVPRDLLILLAVVFATFALGFFVPAVDLLRLTPLVWTRGFAWQIVTYPFIGFGGAGIWFLPELLILYMFGRDVFYGLYRKHFWRLIVVCSVIAALVAVAVHVLTSLTGFMAVPAPFILMQGQRMLLAIFVAAFATANAEATILLFFVLPIRARWFLWLEILFAFMGFLGTRDLPGFLGISAAVGLSYLYVKSSGSAKGGKRIFREMRLRMERWLIQRRLDRAKKKRGLRVIPGDKGRERGPWVN
jgi:signal transduction histidine kinase